MFTDIDTKVAFITSSMPASLGDWNSIFIGDMYEAYQAVLPHLRYWGPDSKRVPQCDSITTASDRQWLDELIAQGGIANVLQNRSAVTKAIMGFNLLHRIRKAVLHNRQHIDVYFINWLQNCLLLPNDCKPLFVTALGTDVSLLSNPLVCRGLRRVFLQRSTTVLYNAEWMGEILAAKLGSDVRCEYRPLGIRDTWFEPTERSANEWISVSRITESKVSTLFRWGTPLFSESEQLTLVGPNQENVVIPAWVKSVGSCSLDDLREHWYPKARGLIFLSEHDEGRPQTIIEAMASGVPVICLNKPLYREFIQSGENGYLVNDPDQLHKAVAALNDPEHNLVISQRARASIKEQVGTWSDFAQDIARRIHQL